MVLTLEYHQGDPVHEKTNWEVGDIFRSYGAVYQQSHSLT